MVRPIAGVFVGGASRRMGGQPKGRLLAPDTAEPLLSRTLRLVEEAGCAPVVVGRAEAYRDLLGAVPVLPDRPSGIGPLGGLSALLEHAGARPCVVLACDMPYVSLELLQRLISHTSVAAVVAPRDAASGRWQPLFARYEPPVVADALAEALAAGERSFQALLARVTVDEFALRPGDEQALRDWDAPADIQA